MLYAIIMSSWLPVATPRDLPPTAHVGPAGLALAAGAFLFGVGMSLSGSCISAHIYRLGEGSLGSAVTLLGVALGFLLGFLTWNAVYPRGVSGDPVVWFPNGLVMSEAASSLWPSSVSF